ncbi:MAG: PilZ domain-containing protein [Desulfobulbaceae bacterium]|nr:PilZ domain-containing protein [Desulfobulbaceae bacterium]
MNERRRSQRIPLKEKCLIHHAGNVGEIIDLSLEGISCWCLNGDQCTTTTSRKVDIFCKEMRLWARGLPMRVLSSELISGRFLGDVPVKICRANFDNLPPEQRAEVENIILSHSPSAGPDQEK